MPEMASVMSFFSSTGFDVVALDHAEDRGQLLQLLERQRGQGATRDRLQRDRGQRTGQGAYGNPAGNLEFVAHISDPVLL
jgi:hypothetical protein